jgi:hypothetical protein
MAPVRVVRVGSSLHVLLKYLIVGAGLAAWVFFGSLLWAFAHTPAAH